MWFDLNVTGCPENGESVQVMFHSWWNRGSVHVFHLWRMHYLEIVASHFVFLAGKTRCEVTPLGKLRCEVTPLGKLRCEVTPLAGKTRWTPHLWGTVLIPVRMLHLPHHPEMIGLHWDSCSHLQKRGEKNRGEFKHLNQMRLR